MCTRPSLRFVPGLILLAFAASCDRPEASVGPPHMGAFAIQSAGGKIAFTSNRAGVHYDLYVMNADGSGVTRLTGIAVNQDNNYEADWSPDGTRIVFTSTRMTPFTEVWVMNADGTGQTQLTFSGGLNWSAGPSWCGNQIAFYSTRAGGGNQIYVMNADGTGVTRLTTNAASDVTPDWSPSCGQIAFTSDRDGNSEIYVMNADGTGQTRLTNNSATDGSPVWSPDGTRLAFATSRDGNSEIYVMNADGTGVTRLTSDAGIDELPAWSPDGSQITFDSNRDGDTEIYVMNADGSGVTALTSNTVDDGWPAWFGQPSSVRWPNEPAGFVQFNDQPWDSLTGNNWSWLRRGGSTDPDIHADPTAPLTPQNVLRITYDNTLQAGESPSVHWIGLPGVDEIYTAWWIKISDNCPDAGCGKMTFLLPPDGGGQVFTAFYHPCVYPEFPDQCSPERRGPPYKVGVNTEWLPYEQKAWQANVEATEIWPGTWHRIEFYYRWETTPATPPATGSGDGIIRWWVDGRLNGNYTNVAYPVQRGFQEFQFAPTVIETPPFVQYMYIDHTHVSTPP